MFTGCTALPDSKATEFGSSNQEASPSAGKNTGVILVSCCTYKSDPTGISSGMDISKVPECHLLRQVSYQQGSQNKLVLSEGHKNYFKD